MSFKPSQSLEQLTLNLASQVFQPQQVQQLQARINAPMFVPRV